MPQSRLRVKLFAKARDLVQSPEIELDWTAGRTVADFKRQLGVAYPELLPLVPRLLVAVNNAYAGNETPLSSNDEIACFPPVSGG